MKGSRVRTAHVRRKNKLLVTTVGVLVLLATLGVTSMNASAAFVSPTQLSESDGTYQEEWVNLEGVVTDLDVDGETITFAVTDGNHTVPVVYEGTVPDTLQDGRVVVAKGQFEGDRLVANKLSVRAHEGEERPESTR
ncbi:cytochrome c maturation protein CcmE domain-containing protein [Halobellus limi]|uniref:Cytochrome c-type biogenesis protein CcmE n=1 Tax=Halobellus limi TaxID=699433 RepID=A0A1H5WFW8_9EURY|nr:cytochrome c maturation protein CcmE [Halobellus limi]SEF98263.1 cytochrome c-type biogenesis protein CcmE [Halobellus limi]